LVLAQAAPGGAFANVIFIGAIALIMYLLIIRPQQKQLKEHRALLSGLKKGDDVVTQGGILGKIYAITDQIVTLEISSGVRIRVLKSSVQSRTKADEPASVAAPEKKEEK
jgi:preprotein translocase subunit YajC